MKHYEYAILGGGMAADAAARGIREIDAEGAIGIISNDVEDPYTRPALSKKLWTDPDFSAADNELGTTDDTGADILINTPASGIDLAARTVTTPDETVGFDKLLLAAGGTPKTIDLEAGERVVYFRTFADYRRLREYAGQNLSVAVIGGGFIGTELAAALAQNATDTTLFFDDAVLYGAVFPRDLALSLHERYLDAGIALEGSVKITGGRREDGAIVLEGENGPEGRFDAVAIGLGIEPATALAERAGLHVDDGIVVDERLRTSAENVFAAGDVARYPDRILGRQRVEHVDNAKTMGRVAGRIMAGSEETYDHTPYFYSNVFDFGYQAVGTLDSSLHTVEDWASPCAKGVVYYLDDGGIVRGVLLVGMDGGLDEARKLLAQGRPYTPGELDGLISTTD